VDQIKFKSPKKIEKPLKVRFDWFLKKVNKRYVVKENNFLRDLNIYKIKLLVLFADQPYSISGGLNYRKYSLKEFREHRIRRTKKRIKNEVAELEKKGLIQTKDDLIAYNYKYNKKRYVKIPHKYAELIFSGKIKASEVKVLFAILLLLYSDLSNQKSVYDMGTKKKKIKTKTLAKLTAKSKRTIKNKIKKLEEKNIIKYTARSGKRDGNWFEIKYDNSQKKRKNKSIQNAKHKQNRRKSNKQENESNAAMEWYRNVGVG
jgi:hypothetical protein